MKRTFAFIAGAITILTAWCQQAKTHIVSQGETIATIAKIYNIAPEKLVEANPGLSNGFFAGMKLTIPEAEPKVSQPNKFVHKVQTGETLSSIARDYGVDAQSILVANPELNQQFYAGMEIEIPLNSGQTTVNQTSTSTTTTATQSTSQTKTWNTPGYKPTTPKTDNNAYQAPVTAEAFSHWFLSYCGPFESLDYGMYGLGWTIYGASGFGARFSGHANYGIVDDGTLYFKVGPIYGKPISDNVLIGAQLLANLFYDNDKDGANGGVTILPHISFRADKFVLSIGAEVGWINGYDDVYNAAHISIGYNF
ncbi:MAG: LysM peptidoglycan-binding domain-containing protein [Muribaculaceae bacterium]|nr:LysM peptidoglycan-binding domain-containing protein [Muribaculaceae bacterium]